MNAVIYYELNEEGRRIAATAGFEARRMQEVTGTIGDADLPFFSVDLDGRAVAGRPTKRHKHQSIEGTRSLPPQRSLLNFEQALALVRDCALAENEATRARRETESRREQYVAAWMKDHGSLDERRRFDAGLLSRREAIEIIEERLFEPVSHLARSLKIEPEDIGCTCTGEGRHLVCRSSEGEETTDPGEIATSAAISRALPRAELRLKLLSCRCSRCGKSGGRRAIAARLRLGPFSFVREYEVVSAGSSLLRPPREIGEKDKDGARLEITVGGDFGRSGLTTFLVTVTLNAERSEPASEQEKYMGLRFDMRVGKSGGARVFGPLGAVMRAPEHSYADYGWKGQFSVSRSTCERMLQDLSLVGDRYATADTLEEKACALALAYEPSVFVVHPRADVLLHETEKYSTLAEALFYVEHGLLWRPEGDPQGPAMERCWNVVETARRAAGPPPALDDTERHLTHSVAILETIRAELAQGEEYAQTFRALRVILESMQPTMLAFLAEREEGAYQATALCVWLLCQGRKTFESCLHNPRGLSDLIDATRGAPEGQDDDEPKWINVLTYSDGDENDTATKNFFEEYRPPTGIFYWLLDAHWDLERILVPAGGER